MGGSKPFSLSPQKHPPGTGSSTPATGRAVGEPPSHKVSRRPIQSLWHATASKTGATRVFEESNLPRSVISPALLKMATSSYNGI
jgi:hypothetical protein